MAEKERDGIEPCGCSHENGTSMVTGMPIGCDHDREPPFEPVNHWRLSLAFKRGAS